MKDNKNLHILILSLSRHDNVQQTTNRIPMKTGKYSPNKYTMHSKSQPLYILYIFAY